jgi:hypothetical protein
MIHRRGVLPALGLLVFVLIGAGMQIASGSASKPRTAAVTPTPTPTQAPEVGVAGAVTASLVAVQKAYNAGDLARLCRSGGLVDPAVIRMQNQRGDGGCEAELETLMATSPPLRLTVRGVTMRTDLATVTVTTASGGEAAVDMVRRGGKWLLSFSDGEDPMSALTGTT